MRGACWFFIVARLGVLAWMLLSHQERVDAGMPGDVRRYMEIAVARGVPYRDFQVEYPPVTYALVRLLTGPDAALSIAAIAISQCLCDLGIAAALRWAWGRRSMLAYLAIGFPLICIPFIYLRIDLFATFLTVASLALLRRQRTGSAGVVLALAVMAKVWPFGVAPILLVERKVRGLVALGTSLLLLGGGWVLVSGTSGPLQVVSFRDATGWQVESVPGVFWHLRDQSRIKFESGAWRTGVMPLWARPLLTLLSLVFIALAWWWAARRRREGGSNLFVYSFAPLASVIALMVFAPILSPQYVIWMLPFAALAFARGDRLVGALAAAIATMSAVSFPFVPAAAEGHWWASLPVLTRNLLLVALFVVALVTLAGRRPVPADSERPRPLRASAAA